MFTKPIKKPTKLIISIPLGADEVSKTSKQLSAKVSLDFSKTHDATSSLAFTDQFNPVTFLNRSKLRMDQILAI